jgi:PucR family transcriptional regulator, purine catabolism regulatory protein
VFPTVREVLDLPAMRRGRPRVVAGRSGLAAPVRWTHVAELPDIAHLLRGGELLLSTGVAFPQDDDGLAGLVDALADIGAAGLVVELGRRFRDRLPAAMVDTADRRGLPLVELHRELAFVQVTESVHALIVDAQLAQLRLSEQVHQTFNELSVEGADPTEVVRQTARMAGTPVVLENLTHQVLAFDAAGQNAADLLDRWEARSRAVQLPGRTGYDPDSGWLVTTVGARGTDWGRLVILEEGAPSPRDVMLVERSAAALALNRLVERDLESLERQTHRTILAALLAHDVPVADVVVRAKALGIPLEGRALVGLVLRLRPAPDQSPMQGQARLRALAETGASAARAVRGLALVGVVDDSSVGVLLSLADRTRADGARREDPDAVVLAAGSTVTTPLDVRRSFLEAAQVADAAAEQPARPFYRLPDVRLRGLVHLLKDDVRLQTYVERELGVLLAHDARHGTRLLDVLRQYLDSGRNKSAAAAAAHLSRPSFYERLSRLEEVLDADLDDVETCLSLHVALRGLDAIRA